VPREAPPHACGWANAGLPGRIGHAGHPTGASLRSAAPPVFPPGCTGSSAPTGTRQGSTTSLVRVGPARRPLSNPVGPRPLVSLASCAPFASAIRHRRPARDGPPRVIGPPGGIAGRFGLRHLPGLGLAIRRREPQAGGAGGACTTPVLGGAVATGAKLRRLRTVPGLGGGWVGDGRPYEDCSRVQAEWVTWRQARHSTALPGLALLGLRTVTVSPGLGTTKLSLSDAKHVPGRCRSIPPWQSSPGPANPVRVGISCRLWPACESPRRRNQ
jgi:hypothetical protein